MICSQIREYLNIIKKNIEQILKESDVYLFGSVLENKLTGGSNIDILIVADVPKKHMLRAEIIASIEEKSELPLYHPFELHFIDFEEFNKWKEIYKLKLEKL
jgi:predicted nucleotidyltransferase